MKDKLELGDLEIDIFKLCNQDRSFLVKMISNLKSEYFEGQTLGRIFTIYQAFFEKFNKPPTSKIVVDMLLKKGQTKERIEPYIERIFETEIIDPTEKDYITEEVTKFGKRARMKEAILESVDLLEVDDFGAITDKVKQALLFNMNVNVGLDLFDVDERFKLLKLSTGNKLSTGFGQLDKVLDGGWSKKELYAFMGPPGIGKSIFLPNIGFKALINNFNVIHYTLEMSEERMSQRYDGIATNIELKHLLTHQVEVEKKYNMIKKLTETKLKIKEFPTGMASVLDIEAHLEQLKLYEDFMPDLIIVDYGDIMKSIKKTMNLYEEQGAIFRELRGLAVKENIVVVTATQSNRDSLGADGQGTKEIIGMGNTADSMEKNRILDGLFTIIQSRKEKDEGRINLWTAKNRNGESSVYLEFLINYEKMQIKEALLGAGNKDDDS